MDRELKVEQLKRSLYLLDETMVAPCARSSQLKRGLPFRQKGQSSKTLLMRVVNALESELAARP
jgi:hypothetical protein